MKKINTYINEKLRLTNKHQYTCQPKDKDELRRIIIQRIKDECNECDLNDIDTSKITDMAFLFDSTIFKDFNGDISQWNVSNVKNMDGMFDGCAKFKCDISMWDVSNVERMAFMFRNCKKFKQNLDSWNVQDDVSMYNAFKDCPTQPKWYDSTE